MMNAMVLKHLTSQRLRPLLNPDAEAVVLHDIRTGIDTMASCCKASMTLTTISLNKNFATTARSRWHGR